MCIRVFVKGHLQMATGKWLSWKGVAKEVWRQKGRHDDKSACSSFIQPSSTDLAVHGWQMSPFNNSTTAKRSTLIPCLALSASSAFSPKGTSERRRKGRKRILEHPFVLGSTVASKVRVPECALTVSIRRSLYWRTLSSYDKLWWRGGKKKKQPNRE